MEVEWIELFQFDVSPAEMFVRGTVIYWFVLILLRISGSRGIGSMGVSDLIVLVLIADAASNAMGGASDSLSSGMIVVGTIFFWSLLIDRVCYFSPAAAKWLEPSKVCLIKDGVLQRRGMRREYITLDELTAEMRLSGIADISDVKRAYMEPEGKISFIKKK